MENLLYDYKLSELVKPCVYLLIRGNVVVYVGQTEQGLKRVLNHYPEKIFDKIKIISCPKENLNELEIENIVKYEPEYNIYLSNTTSIKQFKTNLKLKGCSVRKNDIKSYLFAHYREKLLSFKGEWYISNTYSPDIFNEMFSFFNN